MASRKRAIESVRTSLRLTRAQRATPRARRTPGPAEIDWLREQVRALTDEVRVLADLAQTDDLTGLTNRRGWDEQITRELARARRSAEPLSVALLDLNRFKAFNDVHGHQAGDRLLVAAAAAWRSELRDADTLCRWGGDEFAVLLPDCPEHEADQVIARLVAATPGVESAVAGLACWDGAETPDQLLTRADTALYRSKT